MEEFVLIFLLLVIFFIIYQRGSSGYPSTSSASQRSADFSVGYVASALTTTPPGNPWRDVGTLPGGYAMVAAPAAWVNVSLSDINDIIWNGLTGCVRASALTTLTTPAGVTFGRAGNVWGIRKQFLTSADGSAAGGGSLWFLTAPNFTTEMTSYITATPGSAGFYTYNGTRYGIPQYAVLRKSVYDPQPPVNCSYTSSAQTCNKGAANCEEYGFNQFTVNSITPATHDGASCVYGSTPITTTGQTVLTTTSCRGPPCAYATLSAVNAFGGATASSSACKTAGQAATTSSECCGGLQFYGGACHAVSAGSVGTNGICLTDDECSSYQCLNGACGQNL
jgi:hypothetical protein